MTPDEYRKSVLRTANTDFETLLRSFNENPRNIAVANWAMGLAGEAGEVADYLKKVLFHSHPFDREKLILEVSDCLWYIEALLNEYDSTIVDAMRANEAKLRKRYPEGFNSSASIKRIDVREPSEVS